MSKQQPAQSAPKDAANSKKRKQPPGQTQRPNEQNKKPRIDHRAKQRDARQVRTQTASAALINGELDVDKFVKAREYEIRALEEGMVRSKKALNQRAFQQVPKDLRRRTASHNVKKIPKRLRDRAKREMVEDNTPTVTARRRKPTRHMRLRLDVLKKLRAKRAKDKAGKSKTTPNSVPIPTKANEDAAAATSTPVQTRAPRVKPATLAPPPIPKAKFRKRQISKSWLPTHLYHAKRAHMTPPSQPLWRFSIPLSPTVKSYRPTHRASLERGAIAWDTSYMSTIGLDGQESSLFTVLKGLQIGVEGEKGIDSVVWGRRGQKFRSGLRILESFAFEREDRNVPIAPVTVIFCAVASVTQDEAPRKRRLFLRVHPGAFLQLWEEVLRLAKVAKPQVTVEDLRFEVGSITIKGPGSTEALLGALWPSDVTSPTPGLSAMTVESTWAALAGLNDSSLLPENALLGFNIQDPRLHHPPRTIKLSDDAASAQKLLELIASWPIDRAQQPLQIFDRKSRIAAGASLPSQKAVNRRKALTKPGDYPAAIDKDPKIPVLLCTTSRAKAGSETHRRAQSSAWTVLLPWKCVQPLWYSIMYYPLSTGQQPRFGGLNQTRQLIFEAGQTWFPADFPGTDAGWNWELQERTKRYEAWKRRPRSKRLNWDKVDLGGGSRGEIGSGWACDWERLLSGPTKSAASEDVSMEDAADASGARASNLKDNTSKSNGKPAERPPHPPRPPALLSLPFAKANSLLSSPSIPLPPHISTAVLPIRINLITRGVPQACGRIYRLPTTNSSLRKSWLALHPASHPRGTNTHHRSSKSNPLPRLPKDTPAHVLHQRLAASLLEAPKVGDEEYPACPGEADLVGFVTTGSFNLSEGQGTGIGGILVGRVWDGLHGEGRATGGKKGLDEGRLCIVRNAGTGSGRLARWELAG